MPVMPPSDAQEDARRLRRSFLIAIFFTAALWTIKLSELALGISLSRYSIYPGDPATLIGVLFAPLLHGSLSHLFANTAPVLVLGTGLLYGYPKAARVALPIIYLGSGLAVWLFARPAWHLGASGLAFGLMFFVFTMGVVRWERRAIALSLAVFLLYGGMIWGLLPTDPRISFEYHLAGAALGLLLAVLLRRLDPPAPEKTYSWEQEGSDEDDWPFDERHGEEDAAGGRPPPAKVRGPDRGEAVGAQPDGGPGRTQC
jgi:membrane associated rhomboid family serine protease